MMVLAVIVGDPTNYKIILSKISHFHKILYFPMNMIMKKDGKFEFTDLSPRHSPDCTEVDTSPKLTDPTLGRITINSVK